MAERDFDIIAQEQFKFLELQFGFRLRESIKQPWGYELTFTNATTGIKLSYVFQEAYIFIMLYRLVHGVILENPRIIQDNTNLTGYGLDDILLIRNPEALIKPAYQYGDSSKYYNPENGLTLYVSEFAKNLKEYAQDVLCGDFSIFKTIEPIVKARAKRPNNSLNLETLHKLVKEIIGSYLAKRNFILIKEIDGIVEYESKVMSIRVTYDLNRSFELDCIFEFKLNGESYHYADVREYLYNEKDRLIATQSSSESTVKLWLESLLLFLQSNLQYIVDNHIKVCLELSGLRSEKIKQYSRDREERSFNEDAHSFWNAKDYASFVKLLDNFKGKIDEALRKKYEFASKMLNESGRQAELTNDKVCFKFTDNFPSYVPLHAYWARIDSNVKSKEDLLTELYTKLGMPSYFGFNWDALRDSLADLHWITTKDVFLVHAGIPHIKENDLKTYLVILNSVIKGLKNDSKHHLEVIFPKSSEKDLKSLMSSE